MLDYQTLKRNMRDEISKKQPNELTQIFVDYCGNSSTRLAALQNFQELTMHQIANIIFELYVLVEQQDSNRLYRSCLNTFKMIKAQLRQRQLRISKIKSQINSYKDKSLKQAIKQSPKNLRVVRPQPNINNIHSLANQIQKDNNNLEKRQVEICLNKQKIPTKSCENKEQNITNKLQFKCFRQQAKFFNSYNGKILKHNQGPKEPRIPTIQKKLNKVQASYAPNNLEHYSHSFQEFLQQSPKRDSIQSCSTCIMNFTFPTQNLQPRKFEPSPINKTEIKLKICEHAQAQSASQLPSQQARRQQVQNGE